MQDRLPSLAAVSPRRLDRIHTAGRGPSRIHGFVIAWVWLVLAPGASAQVPVFPEEFDRVDVISIVRDQRDLFGFDALRGGRARVRLEVSEVVLFQETQGRIGLVLTNRRALAIAPGSGFQEFRYRVNEEPPLTGFVENQIALVATPRRVLAFVEGAGLWFEEGTSPSESLQAVRVGSAVGVFVTNRRAPGDRRARSGLRVHGHPCQGDARVDLGRRHPRDPAHQPPDPGVRRTPGKLEHPEPKDSLIADCRERPREDSGVLSVPTRDRRGRDLTRVRRRVLRVRAPRRFRPLRAPGFRDRVGFPWRPRRD